MNDIPTTGSSRPLRADARRNHQLLLTVARDLFVERGPDAPLEEIARRGGVGIGTLYRRFADRPTLMRAVVLDALRHTGDAAERALADSPQPLAALAAYMHAVIDLRTSAVIPTLLNQVDLDDPDIRAARERSAALTQRLIDEAHVDGSLRKDVTFGDVGLMLVRLARPLPGPIPAEMQQQLAHRHVDLLLMGLQAGGESGQLADPALELRDLRAWTEEGASGL